MPDVTADNPAPPYRAATRPRVDPRLVREVVAVLLLVAGAAGLAVAAFLWAFPAGLAVVSAEAATVGVVLGYDR